MREQAGREAGPSTAHRQSKRQSRRTAAPDQVTAGAGFVVVSLRWSFLQFLCIMFLLLFRSVGAGPAGQGRQFLVEGEPWALRQGWGN